MARETTPVAIIGAGPYGLAAAAHLTAAGASVRMFGRPMSFWQSNMPAGMWLRSSWNACHIADPHGTLTLDAYQASQGRHLARPVPRGFHYLRAVVFNVRLSPT